MVISFQKIISHGLSSPLFSLLNQFILLATPFQVFYPTYVLHIIPICPVKTNRFYIFAPHANQSKMIMIPYISYFDYQPRQSVKFPRTFFYLYLRSITRLYMFFHETGTQPIYMDSPIYFLYYPTIAIAVFHIFQ